MAIFRPKCGSQTSKSRIRFSQYLEKYLEFPHFVKSSEFSGTSSIRRKQLVKKVSGPPPYTLKGRLRPRKIEEVNTMRPK